MISWGDDHGQRSSHLHACSMLFSCTISKLVASLSDTNHACVVCDNLYAGIKHIHVLPLVSQFCLMAHDLEVALVEGLAAAGTAAQQQRQTGGKEEEAGLAADVAHAEEATAVAAAQSVRQGGVDCTLIVF